MTYAGVPAFMIEFTGRVEVGLRRYVRHSDGWTCADGYHHAKAILGSATPVTGADGYIRGAYFAYPPHDDPRWPAKCDGCDYLFTAADEWQNWQESQYRRADTGAVTTIRDAPPGAMWDAWWYPWKGPDGRSLVVKCPNGAEWTIDGRASNCALPDDTVHRCWVRHGEPPNITVDKDGVTCAAGAGSIAADDYHGFLQGGRFTDG
ncbi:MAG TPA: hypothetical protein VHT75_04330 [Acidimicrobiales bacterium]|jgi:hypothetical protein|nr:hypothetical protein [Acidimicrobiales bacterium]